MFKVTGKKSGIVWDKEENKALAKFQKGVFETEDKKAAVKLKALGYQVEETKSTPPAME